MTREQMLDTVIKTRGFEDKWTIWFATIMEDENLSDDVVLDSMVAALAMPIAANEDEEEEEEI